MDARYKSRCLDCYYQFICNAKDADGPCRRCGGAIVDYEDGPRPAHGLIDRQVGGDHYTKLAVQPWDALKAWLTPEQYKGYMIGTAIVYLARQNGKNGDEDIAKAAHYLEKLQEKAPT